MACLRAILCARGHHVRAEVLVVGGGCRPVEGDADQAGPDPPRSWVLLGASEAHLHEVGRSARQHQLDSTLERLFGYPTSVGTWHDPDLGRPIAAPLERCAELLGVDLATVRELAANVEPYIRADGTRIWSLMQLERQFRPERFGRRRGGYLDRRRTSAADA